MFLRALQIAAFSSDALIGKEVSARPPGPTAGATKAEAALSLDVARLKSQLTDDNGSTRGSNGIAIGSQDTANADGMVLVNPHFPWNGENRFWMAQLTVPGQYNVEGANFTASRSWRSASTRTWPARTPSQPTSVSRSTS